MTSARPSPIHSAAILNAISASASVMRELLKSNVDLAERCNGFGLRTIGIVLGFSSQYSVTSYQESPGHNEQGLVLQLDQAIEDLSLCSSSCLNQLRWPGSCSPRAFEG